MIEIIGPALSQWDVGRSVKITNIEADHFHLANKGDLKAVIMEIAEAQAKIPDYLLQTGKQLCVYAVKDGITVESNIFFVRKRERPENYVYEDDQRNYIYELITSAENAIEGASHAVEEANLALENANTAASKVNAATENAVKSAASASEAAKNANEAAAKASHTAKSLMVVGEASGTNITLDDAIEQYFVGCKIFGKSTQDGIPTPDAPVDIVSIGDGGSITVSATGEDEANSMTVATPNGLPGIPVSSGGNYTDANGQQWICDEIDFGRGVYVQRVGTVVLDGSSDEAWVYFTTIGNQFHIPVSNCYHSASVSTVHSTHFAADIIGSRVAIYDICYSYSAGVAVNTRLATSLTEWRAWLAENPITMLYRLATPIETPLSDAELAAYASLHTYRGTTTVSNDASAHMEVEYVMDAKKYIDRLLAGGSSATIVDASVE